MLWLEIIFLLSVFIIFFAYLGYPLTLLALRARKSREEKRDNITPNISIIIAAYNEEKRIEGKIRNTLEIDYPADKVQIILTSDGSTDKTIELASKYLDQGLELLKNSQRKGKESAQKEALKIAKGEIFIFTDVATRISREGIRNIVSNFADPTVGCVSSVDVLIEGEDFLSGEKNYLDYEMSLRNLESQVNSLVGLSGSFFAARREVCSDFSEDMQSDFRVLLNSIKMGLRGISDVKSIGFYQDILNKHNEMNRKIRTVLRGMTVFFKNLQLLNFFKYGLFSYQLFCHKFLRWVVPFFLAAAFITNFILSFSNFYYLVLFVLQLLLYLLSILGILKEEYLKNKIIKICWYFVMANFAILMAWLKYFKGEEITKWNPSHR